MNQNALPQVAPAPQQPPLPSASPTSVRTPPPPASDNFSDTPMSSPSTPVTHRSSTRALDSAAARETALAKKLQAMLLETAKQQIHVNTNPLDAFHRFENPYDFLQFSNFTDAIR